MLCCVRTFLIVGLLRTLDVYRDVPLALRLWGSLFSPRAWGAIGTSGFWSSLGLSYGQWGLLALGVLAMYTVGKITRTEANASAMKWGAMPQRAIVWGEQARRSLLRKPIRAALLLAVMIAVIAVFGRYGYGYDATQFIYNQF